MNGQTVTESERQVITVINDSKIICTAGGIAGSCLHSSRTGRGCVLVGRSSILIAAAALIAAIRFGASKVDVVCHDLHSGAVVSVLVLILAGLETAFDGDQTALLEILGDELCLLAPCDDVDEIGLTLLALTGKVGSATRRPMIATTFNIIRTPFSSRKDYSSWATIRLRITPSVILYTRSSSAGKLGSAVKLITV
mgnify:CR=1 FL=1